MSSCSNEVVTDMTVVPGNYGNYGHDGRVYGGMYLPPYYGGMYCHAGLSATLLFLPQHIIFSKKILCCGKFVT